LFRKLSVAFEQIRGTANQLSVALKKPVHLQGEALTNIDLILEATVLLHTSWKICTTTKWRSSVHLNFPNYSLEEKNTQGKEWTRQEWAYARLGDFFTHRTPAALNQEMARVLGDAENYIAAYNIVMGNLLTEDGRRLFPEDMVLLSHWNLRDEIKSNYAPVPDALEKQKMIQK